MLTAKWANYHWVNFTPVRRRFREKGMRADARGVASLRNGEKVVVEW